MTASGRPEPVRRDRGLWVQCACTRLVGLGAAFASYRHGQAFAARFGADPTTAANWPLIVDGLLTTATVELWKPGSEGGRWRAWSAFLFGVALSLCAKVASAPELSAPGVAVAASPPLAMLLAVELLNRALKRHRADTAHTKTSALAADTAIETGETVADIGKTSSETGQRPDETANTTGCETPLAPGYLALVPRSAARVTPTAEDRMWADYQTQRARGRTPTGAELGRGRPGAGVQPRPGGDRAVDSVPQPLRPGRLLPPARPAGRP